MKELKINATHIIFVSDIHFGKHVNSEEWQENMSNYFYHFFIPKIREVKASLKEGEKLICMNLGDTYDDRKAIDINVNNLCIDVCADIAKEVEYYVLNGNHDLAKKTNEGNSSLKSIEYIPNLFLIQEPTYITINNGKKDVNFIAIPYLGNNELETKYLADYSGKAKYALMHTELTKMKMDNGMLITSGANPDMFKGMILSGHIHRRQETKHIIYVGSPYQMSKGDIGNECGIYVLNLLTNKLEFTPNLYSPIYQKILIEEYDQMNIDYRKRVLDNNYTYVIIEEDDIPKYKKKYDIFNLGIGTTAKYVKPIVIKHKQDISADEEADYQEASISELINESIHQLDVDEDAMKRLEELSNNYLKEAESKLLED